MAAAFQPPVDITKPLEQIFIVNDANVIRLRNTVKFSSILASTPQHSLPQYLVPNLDRYLRDTCTSAILYRQHIIRLFRQRPSSKIVPKRIQLIGNNGNFKGASVSRDIINSENIDVGSFGVFALYITLDRDKKRLFISMKQKEQTTADDSDDDHEEGSDDEDKTKLLGKPLSKAVCSIAKLYRVLDTQNATQPRPWTLSTNKDVSLNDISRSTSKIISGTLLDKVCTYINNQFTISINLKEYRLGNARLPHKPKITIIMEHKY